MAAMEPITLYAVVRHDGTLRLNRDRRYMIYSSKGPATRQASQSGDSVVRVTVHLDEEPLFIRERIV